MLMSTVMSNAQHLSSARAIGMGGYTAFADGLDALDWNPAGLIGLKDWELEGGNFLSPAATTRSWTFQLAGIGKRFPGIASGAFRISPGISLDFDVPSSFTIEDSSRTVVNRFDKKISYTEPYAFGAAYSFGDAISAGFSIHRFENHVSDTRFAVDSNSVIQSTPIEFSAGAFLGDFGILWTPQADYRVGVVAKHIVQIVESRLPDEEQQYLLTLPRYARAGVGYSGIDRAQLSLDGDTKKQFRVGGEWAGPSGLMIRGGLYLDGSASLSADAITLGIGGSYLPVKIDLSYLKFFSETDRRGSANVSTFQSSDITSVEYNRFTGDRLSMTARVNLGGIRTTLAQIEQVDMNGEIFPAMQPLYAYRPLGRAVVRNTAKKKIEVKLSFFIDNVMDSPTETKSYDIQPGDTVGIPFCAVLSDSIRSVRSLAVRNAELTVVARADDEDSDERRQSRMLIHGRNDWNGDINLLRYFVTPDDSEVLRFTRSYLNHYKVLLDTVPTVLSNIARAKVIFNEFAVQLLYVNDPKKSEDFVQYPGETLRLRGGDCDDLSVCYSALLASMGLSTAFVDVVPPDQPEDAHVYLMFDTGISPGDASLLSDNPKRYVIRGNDRGVESVWVPVESTMITKGFEEAWEAGAQEYYNDVEVKLGLIKGWVRVVDLGTVN
jgi:hypothetical protein